jgi:hypothetical protein
MVKSMRIMKGKDSSKTKEKNAKEKNCLGEGLFNKNISGLLI